MAGLSFKNFLDIISDMVSEIGGDKETKTGSHTYPPTISVDVYNANEQFIGSAELFNIEPDTHLGCGCWTGIRLQIKLEENK